MAVSTIKTTEELWGQTKTTEELFGKSSFSTEELFGKQAEPTIGLTGKVLVSQYKAGERNVLGNIVERPAAAVREAIRAPWGQKLEAYQRGAINPTDVKAFQDAWLNEFWKDKKNIKMIGPGNLIPGNLPTFGHVLKGMGVSTVGLTSDILTSPFDMTLILSAGPIGKLLRTTPWGAAAVRFMTKGRRLPLTKTTLGKIKAKAPQFEQARQAIQPVFERATQPQVVKPTGIISKEGLIQRQILESLMKKGGIPTAKEIALRKAYKLPTKQVVEKIVVPKVVKGIIPPTAKISKGEAVSQINLSKYTPEIQTGIKNIIFKHPEVIKRKTISHRELEGIAKRLKDTPIVRKILAMREGELAAEALKLRQGEDILVRSALRADLKDLGKGIKNLLQIRQTRTVGKVGTELGRALEQQKISIQAQTEIANLINQKIFQIGKDPIIKGIEARKLIGNLTDLRKTVLSKDFNPTWIDKGYEFWLNNILSGPWTHTVNITSNTLFATTKPLEKGLYSIWDVPLSWFTGKRTHYFAEIPRQVKGLATAFTRKELPGGIKAGTKLDIMRPPLIKGVKGRIIRIPTKTLIGEDNYSKRLVGFMELMGRAETIARQEGLKGANLVARRNQLIANPTEKLLSEVGNEQLIRTFQDTTGLGELLKDIPQRFFRWILPFRKTLSSIITKGLERTPLGFIKAGYRGVKRLKGIPYPQYEVAMDLGNASLGTAIGAGLVYAYLKGNITGAPPRERGKRDLFYAQGKQPYSVRLDDKWVPFGRLEPYGTAAMQMIDLLQGYMESDKDTPQSKITDAVFNLTYSLTNKSFLSGMTNFLNAVVNPERYGEPMLTRLIGGFTPFAGLSRTITRITDLGVKEAEGLLQSIMKDIPIISKKIPNRINILGRDIERQPLGLSKYIPFPITKEKRDLVVDELVRIKYPIGYPTKRIRIGIEEVKLNREDYRRFIIGTGQRYYRGLFNLFSDPRYWMIPDEFKKKPIQTIINGWRQIGKGQLRSEELQRRNVFTTEELFGR